MQRIGLADWERDAAALLSPMVADYFAGGARDELTLHANRAAWSQYALRFRVLTGAAPPDTSATVLGMPLRMPILVAPTAFHGLAHPEAETATAAGTRAAGTAMCLSTLSNTAVEAVVAEGAPVLFQLYVYRDRGATRAIVDRARAAGCRALVLTADAARLGTRERDVRNGFHLPSALALPNVLAPGWGAIPSAAGDSGLARYVGEALEPSLSWRDLEDLVASAGLPVLMKGLVRGDDAKRAKEAGVAGVIVSNHGGRQLDGAIPTARALPEVVDAVGGGCEVWVDGGIRRGTDVLRALALGADAVLVGRPALWGLAVDGAAGVLAVLETLRSELEEAMALAGAETLADLDRSLILPV